MKIPCEAGMSICTPLVVAHATSVPVLSHSLSLVRATRFVSSGGWSAHNVAPAPGRAIPLSNSAVGYFNLVSFISFDNSNPLAKFACTFGVLIT